MQRIEMRLSIQRQAPDNRSRIRHIWREQDFTALYGIVESLLDGLINGLYSPVCADYHARSFIRTSLPRRQQSLGGAKHVLWYHGTFEIYNEIDEVTNTAN